MNSTWSIALYFFIDKNCIKYNISCDLLSRSIFCFFYQSSVVDCLRQLFCLWCNLDKSLEFGVRRALGARWGTDIAK